MTNTKIKNSVYEAIDVIVEKRIEDLCLDKTVKCNIIACLNSREGKYKVSYAGGEMIAYAKDGKTYLPNVEIYVTIPQGNFSNKKWIIDGIDFTQSESNNLIEKFSDEEATLDTIKQKINEIIDKLNSIL